MRTTEDFEWLRDNAIVGASVSVAELKVRGIVTEESLELMLAQPPEGRKRSRHPGHTPRQGRGRDSSARPTNERK